ncbi:VanZ family protein [Ornithinibacillus sp. 179-J 7C1 HS]|uniref:VanZ family protein n=1 Tax=Ornithinibacillus sp. 179-J 7C1 HS TaxID=3142384 RepID=UPI00399F0ADE
MKYINDIPILLIAITLMIYVPLRLIYRKRHFIKDQYIREITIILLIAYVETILYLTLYPSTPILTNNVSINLVPFKTINLYINFQGDTLLQIINLFGNVVVFVPIGIFALILMERVSFFTMILIGFGSTLFIEVMQLILSINEVIARSFDVDDLMLNTIGVLIGYLIGLVIKKLFPHNRH